MANFIMYGYKGDEDLARLSLKALNLIRKTEERIVFLDDAFDRTSDDFRSFLKEEGVELCETTHPRNGNLIGPDHTRENAKLLGFYARQAMDQTCVKVDCDTMVFGRSWLDEFAKNENEWLIGGYHSQVNYMFGLCYAIKAGLAEMIERDTSDHPPWIKCFEDFEISSRAMRLAPDKIRRISLANPNSLWACCTVAGLANGRPVEVLDVNRGDPRANVLKVMGDTLKSALAKHNKGKQNENANP